MNDGPEDTNALSRFWSGLMVAVGLLFIATGGLCAAAFVVSALWTSYLEVTMTTAHGVATTTRPGFDSMILVLAGAAIPVLIAGGILWTGIRMLRQGLAGLRRKDEAGPEI